MAVDGAAVTTPFSDWPFIAINTRWIADQISKELQHQLTCKPAESNQIIKYGISFHHPTIPPQLSTRSDASISSFKSELDFNNDGNGSFITELNVNKHGPCLVTTSLVGNT